MPKVGGPSSVAGWVCHRHMLLFLVAGFDLFAGMAVCHRGMPTVDMSSIYQPIFRRHVVRSHRSLAMLYNNRDSKHGVPHAPPKQDRLCHRRAPPTRGKLSFRLTLLRSESTQTAMKKNIVIAVILVVGFVLIVWLSRKSGCDSPARNRGAEVEGGQVGAGRLFM